MNPVVINLVLTEMAVILALLFRTPLRKLVMKGLDRVKQGRGPLVVKTIAATMLVVFGSTLYNTAKIRRRTAEAGVLSQTDEILMGHRLLEASMIGEGPFSFLFFA